jgi:homoserine kinase type II
MSDPPPPVLVRYGEVVRDLRWVALGTAGGFSGASLWRGEYRGEPAFALKSWPTGITEARLADIHNRMARAAHLPFVPAVVATADGPTVATVAGRVWDLTVWMPGVADYSTGPAPTRLAAACTALARLHQAWRPDKRLVETCPGVRNRLRVLAGWRGRAVSRPPPTTHSDLNRAIDRGLEAARAAAERAELILRKWDGKPVVAQSCLCDVWGAHVLFTGDRVTGLIDYGAVKDDHVAVDLARLLGDLVGDDDRAFADGLAAYRAAGGMLDAPDEFVRTLDRTGTVCAVINWLTRLSDPDYVVPDAPAVALRLERLAARVESASARP